MTSLGPVGGTALAAVVEAVQRLADAPGAAAGPNTEQRLVDAVPHIHQGEGSEWVAQGLGFDKAASNFFTTYYRDDPPATVTQYPGNTGTPIEVPNTRAEDPNVLLSVQDGASGDEVTNVYLDGPVGGHEVTKGGGVAVDGEFAYVADTSQVYVYKLSDIYSAQEGEVVEAVVVNSVETGSASYINIHDGKAYVGRWVENHPFKRAGDGVPEAHVYNIDPQTGRFVDDAGKASFSSPVDLARSSAAPVATIDTPYNVQGIAVTDDGVLFSASFGSFGPAPSDLIWQSWNDRDSFELGAAKNDLDVPDYNEGVQIVDGRVYLATEEGADKYKGEDGLNEARSYDLDDVRSD